MQPPPPPDRDGAVDDRPPADRSAPGGTGLTDAPDATTPTRLPLPASVILVAVGGGGGTLCRYELELLAPAATGGFPWVTTLVNLSGAAVLGLVLTILTGRRTDRSWAVVGRPLVATGFIGAYTTWSTFMVETVGLLRAGDPAVAFAYLAVSLVGGLAAATLGVTIAIRLGGTGAERRAAR